MTSVIDPTDLAATCCRAWCAACGQAPPTWEHLSLQEQAPWLRVALYGEKALLGCEGKSYAEAGAVLAKLQANGDAGLLELALSGTRNRTAYEALARHLMALLDGEGNADLPAMEQSWAAWAAGRQSAASNEPFLVER